jgi:hypothetical protein
MRYLLAIWLLCAVPVQAAVWDETTIGDIIDDVKTIKGKVLTGDIAESAADFRRQLDDLNAHGTFVKEVLPEVLMLLQNRRQPILDFAGPTFDCDAGTPCAEFRQQLRDFGTDFAGLSSKLPMLQKAGIGDGSRLGKAIDVTPPFLLFFLHEALNEVADWQLIPRDLADLVDEVDDPDAFASDWRPSRLRDTRGRLQQEASHERSAADTFCANRADRVSDPRLDKVALNRWKAALTSTKLVVAAFAEFIPDTIGGSVLGEGLSDVKIPIQAIVKAIASAVEASGVLLDTFQANLDFCRSRVAAAEQHAREVETHLATCTELNVYRTSSGSAQAYERLSDVLATAETEGQGTASARSAVRIVDNYRSRKQWSLAYRFMCKAYARIGDGPG